MAKTKKKAKKAKKVIEDIVEVPPVDEPKEVNDEAPKVEPKEELPKEDMVELIKTVKGRELKVKVNHEAVKSLLKDKRYKRA